MKRRTILIVIICLCVGYIAYPKTVERGGAIPSSNGTLVNSGSSIRCIGIPYGFTMPMCLGKTLEAVHTESMPVPVGRGDSTKRYTCADEKRIFAVIPWPRVKGSTADLTLSDGRIINLVATSDATDDGMSYVNEEGVEFSYRGDNADLREKGTTTFVGCVLVR